MRKGVLIPFQIAAILVLGVTLVGCDQFVLTFRVQNTGIQPVKVFYQFYSAKDGQWGPTKDFVQYYSESHSTDQFESHYGEQKPGAVDERGLIQPGNRQDWGVSYGFPNENGNDRWSLEARTIGGGVVCSWEFVRHEIEPRTNYFLSVPGCGEEHR